MNSSGQHGFFLALAYSCLLALPAHAVSIISAGSGIWTNTTTWSPAQIPTLSDDVTIQNGHTVTISDISTHDVGALIIQTNGVLTHTANFNTEAYKVILNIATNLTIDLGGSISATAKGYGQCRGPGVGLPTNGWEEGGGASYGGRGGDGSYGRAGVTYGSVTSPTNLGSGGGWDVVGGGAVLLTVGGAATINGTVSADAYRGVQNDRAKGGSGGSVFLVAGSLAGSGVMSAKGAGWTYAGAGQGGGGRIAVRLTEGTTFGSVVMQAFGAANNSQYGGAGTIYIETTNDIPGQGTLIVDNNGFGPLAETSWEGDNVYQFTWPRTVQLGIGPSSNRFAVLKLLNGGIYEVDADDILDTVGTTIIGDSDDQKDGLFVNGGTWLTDSDFAFSNYFVRLGVAASGFDPSSSVIIGTNAQLYVDYPAALRGNVTVQSGGSILHRENSTGEVYKLDLSIAGNLTVQSNGTIDVAGRGYKTMKGPGVGLPRGTSESAGGAGHGGRGGAYFAGQNGITYGSILAPLNCGSGGGWDGYGGGAAILTVGGTTTVSGTINANARGPTMNDRAKGSSGGSVFLKTGYLTGAGTISADGGGQSYADTGQGAGGRIAVIVSNGTDLGSVTFHAYSSAANANHAAAGTIYIETVADRQGRGRLLIDNDSRNLRTNSVTDLPPLTNGIVSEYKWVKVIVTNNSVALATTNLTVGDVFVYTGATLDLNFMTLTVNQTKHDLGGGATNNLGKLVWRSPGMLLVIQ